MFRFSKNNKLNLLTVFNEAKHTYDEVPYIKKRRTLALAYRVLKYFSILVLVGFVILVLLFLIYVKDIREFYNYAFDGKKSIEKAIELILTGEYKKGSAQSISAGDSFARAILIAEKYKDNNFLKIVGYLRVQFDDVEYLIHSAEIISKAVSQSAEFADALESILVNKERNFNKLNTEDKKNLLEIIYKSSPELNGIKANIDLAMINLKQISYTGVLLPFKPKVSEIETKLSKVQEGLSMLIPLSNFVPVVFGYPEKSNFLFILQNSDELRPTGGFIGTYGILQTEYGDIARLDTHDVYHLDMPVKDTFSKDPPAPLKKYLGTDKWYMRDANWSPDWPSSAKLIQWFYHEEDKLLPPKDQVNNFSGEFSGVVAITPELITDLLALTGPIYIADQEFNQNNFVDLLQYKVEQEYIQLGVSSWHRKAVIGEIVKELKIRLFDLNPTEMYAVLDVFNTNFLEKNILLFFNDQGFEEIAMDKSWTGEIKQTDGDYLMVVDANMASYKTDAVMNKAMYYSVEQGVNTEMNADLILNYAHNGNFDWKTTRYQTYTRVYVPRGSQLISIEGAGSEKTEVYDEYGKTVFGFFASIEPGNMKNIRIKYRLAKTVEEKIKNNSYSLLIQKQAGRKVEQMSVVASFSNNVEAYQPTGFYANKIDKKSIKWDTDLKSDKTFNIKINR